MAPGSPAAPRPENINVPRTPYFGDTQAEGLVETGQGLLKAGQVLSALNRGMAQARQVSELATAKLTSREKLYDLVLEVQKNPDPATWADTYRSQGEKIFGELAQSLKDPEVQANFKMHWASAFPLMHHGVVTEARQRQISQFRADLDVNVARAAKLYIRARNDLERTQIKDDLLKAMDRGVSSMVISPDNAGRLLQSFDQEVSLAQVRTDAGKDPKGVLDRLKEPEKFYPGLPPGSALQMQGTVTAELHRRQGEKALAVDQMYSAKQLTRPQLTALRDSRDINLSTFRFYDAALERDAMPEPAKTNTDEYVSAWKLAEKGQLDENKLYGLMKAGQLEKMDAHRLMTINSHAAQGKTPKEFEFLRNPFFRNFVDEIEHTLKPLDMRNLEERTRLEIGLPVGPQSSITSEAVDTYLKACKEAQGRGELTDQFMRDKKTEIIRSFGLKGASRMLQQPGTPAGAGKAAPPAVPQFNPTRGPKASQLEKW